MVKVSSCIQINLSTLTRIDPSSNLSNCFMGKIINTSMTNCYDLIMIVKLDRCLMTIIFLLKCAKCTVTTPERSEQ